MADVTQQHRSRRPGRITPADEFGARVIDFAPRARRAAAALPIPLPLPLLSSGRPPVAGQPAQFAAGAPRPVPMPRPVFSRASEVAPPPGAIVPLPDRAERVERNFKPRRSPGSPAA